MRVGIIDVPDYPEALNDKQGHVRSGVWSSGQRAKLRSLQHRARGSALVWRRFSLWKDVESLSHPGTLIRSLELGIRSFRRLVIARYTHSAQISRSETI